MTDETIDLLIRARGFLERGWCRGAQAIDRCGRRVEATSEQAVAWCAYGALVAAGLPRASYSPEHVVVRRLQDAIGDEFIASFNNRQETVEPVLAAFDRAIAAVG